MTEHMTLTGGLELANSYMTLTGGLELANSYMTLTNVNLASFVH